MRGFVNQGAKKLSGDQTALAVSVSGTTLKFTPPKGAYDGVATKVVNTDANRLAANILSGKTIDGVAGSAPRQASGSGTLSSVTAGLGAFSIPFPANTVLVFIVNGAQKGSFMYSNYRPSGSSTNGYNSNNMGLHWRTDQAGIGTDFMSNVVLTSSSFTFQSANFNGAYGFTWYAFE